MNKVGSGVLKASGCLASGTADLAFWLSEGNSLSHLQSWGHKGLSDMGSEGYVMFLQRPGGE